MNKKAIHRLLMLLAFLATVCSTVTAQTMPPFERVFDACKRACEAFAGGFASSEQLLAVSKTLRDAEPAPLTIKQIRGDVLSLKGHLVFDYEFIDACINDESIYEMADKYAAEAKIRGNKNPKNKVRLDTKMVAAGQTCTFEIPGCSGTSQIGCVAEVNRNFSWKIKTISYKSKTEQEYKSNDNVRKGLPFRKEVVSSNERYKIIVSITNKSKDDSSFAIVLF
jgi:hypothetical protein